MKPGNTTRKNEKKSAWGLGLSLLVIVTVFTTFIVIGRPEPGSLSEMETSSQKDMAKPEENKPEMTYRTVERDGGRAVAVPKQARRAAQTAASSSDKTANEPRDELMDQIIQLLDNGEWQQAEQLLIAHLEKHPQDERALVEMAMLQLIERRNPLVARDFLERALVVNPDNESAINELLVVYQETNNLDGGLQFLRQLSETHPDTAAIEYGLGNALLKSGRAEESLEYFQRAMSMTGFEDVFLQEQAASAYVEAGRFDEGVDLLRDVIAQETDQFRLKNLKIKLAAAYLNRNEREEALSILYDLQSQHPQDELVAQIIKDLTSGRL
ncbi:MAG: tetratricopeptide repeat protein [Oligoflexus sp.]